MSSSSNTGKAGIIKAADDAGSMDKLAHTVLDDLLYNIVHDLLIKVHRDEKIARAATAAIRVEKLASDASDSSLTTESRPDIKAETDAAVYDEGRTLLKGNPLETTKDILCPRCHLPRLLYPTDGKGAKKPDPSIIYCKKHPYIDKPGYDIYGQTWVAQGPGRGKKKKDMEKKVETTPQDTPGATPTPEEGGGGKGGAASRPPNVLSFPSATCVKCKRCILVTRLNNHMGSCIGNSGRNASRAAAQKISNGSSNGNHNGSQGDGTPPNSQKGTPLPGSRASSPKKRDSDDVDDDDDTDNDAHKKKKIKSAPNPTKKVILKTKGGSGAPGPKKEKVKTSSLLSVEQKVDDDDAEGSTVEVAPKKKINKSASPAKKLKLGVSKPLLSSPGTTKNGKPAKSNGAGGGGGDDGESESSGTLSSPPVV
ncbi:transcriptional activator [Apiospora arundinis]|uniref:Transcriptional activator n=1 Tax=Apiospora arundinis TaxID=335852 RepID=A0ABR2HRK0_9PEZI